MKIVVIEDEMRAAKQLEKNILSLEPNVEIIDRLDSVKSAVHFFNQHSPDLVFLDIHLADGLCFEIFDQVDVGSPIIFTTAYDEYALKAFDVYAVDYLLKPIKKEELKKAIEKFKRQNSQNSLESSENKIEEIVALFKDQGQQKEKRFLVKIGQQLKIVYEHEIAYIYTEDKMTFLINRQGRRFHYDATLDKLNRELEGDKFFRINRKFIVNIDAIKTMHMYSKSRVKLDLIPSTDLDSIVSTERSGNFKKWLAGKL